MTSSISNTDIFILKLKSSKHLKSNFILLYDLFYDEGVKVITPFELFKLNNFYSRVQYYQQILVLFFNLEIMQRKKFGKGYCYFPTEEAQWNYIKKEIMK